jgi:hypothetical protein
MKVIKMFALQLLYSLTVSVRSDQGGFIVPSGSIKGQFPIERNIYLTKTGLSFTIHLRVILQAKLFPAQHKIYPVLQLPSQIILRIFKPQ